MGGGGREVVRGDRRERVCSEASGGDAHQIRHVFGAYCIFGAHHQAGFRRGQWFSRRSLEVWPRRLRVRRLRDKSQVLRACQGAEVVFHMAAPDSYINNHQLHQSVNVQGTKNIIDACVELKVKRPYTSSPSVVFDGANGSINGNESIPYPAKFIIGDGNNMYDFKRALASEQSVSEKAAGQVVLAGRNAYRQL